jgi:hypothetical protein
MDDPDDLRVEVRGADIFVAMRGTCFRATYRKGDAPWLVAHEHGPDDPEARITLSEFRALAWEAATAKARQLGWIEWAGPGLKKGAAPAIEREPEPLHA